MDHTQKKNRNLLLLIILLAIFLHLLLLFLLFRQIGEQQQLFNIDYKKEISSPIDSQEDENFAMPDAKPEPESTASLKQKKSDFGLPVSLDYIDEPKEELSAPPEEKIETQPSIEQEKIIEPIKQETEILDEVSVSDKIENVLNETQEINLIESKISENVVQKENVEKKIVKRKKRKSVTEILNKNKRTIIVPGLAQFTDQNGKDLITRYGNDNISPSLEDLRNASYISKIAWAMQNAWNIKKHQLKINRNLITTLGITMTIDKDGKLVYLAKTLASPYKAIDDLVLETIRYAAPFPPIPKHLKKDIFVYTTHIEVTITDNAKRGKRFSVF